MKVGDKVIDSSGVLFSITAIDTQNSTFTIGTALIDLAQDSDVVHKSGNETVGGVKTFSDNPVIGNNNTNITISNRQITANGSYSAPTGSSYIFMQLKAIVNYADSSPSIGATVGLSIQENAYSDGKRAGFNPNSNNTINLGLTGKRWANVYATNYYYGSSEIEFSQKFVTTDTAQTISGAKTFSDTLTIYNSDDTQTPKGLVIRNAQWGIGESGGTTVSTISFLDKNSAIPASVTASKGFYGQSFLRFNVRTKDSQNNAYSEEIYYDIDTSGNVEFRSWHNNIISLGTPLYNIISLGTPLYKWKDVQTYKVNNLEPSSLSLPSDRSARIDISSYFTNTGTGQTNNYTVPANGYIYLTLSELTNVHCFSSTSGNVANYAQTFTKINNSTGVLYVLFPVRKNDVFKTTWYTTTTVSVDGAYFIPCQGNV